MTPRETDEEKVTADLKAEAARLQRVAKMQRPAPVIAPVEVLEKLWYTSKTVYAGLGAIGSGLAGVYLVLTNKADVDTLTTSLTAIVSGVVTIYGRVTATHQISRSMV